MHSFSFTAAATCADYRFPIRGSFSVVVKHDHGPISPVQCQSYVAVTFCFFQVQWCGFVVPSEDFFLFPTARFWMTFLVAAN